MKIKINEKKLLSDLHLAFTDKYSPIREMVQNAKRSHATEVNVEYYESTGYLCVSNNGDIIEDFQTLISVSESGWSDEIKETEKPYGLGFLSVLFSSKSDVTIHSGNQKLVINTDDLLKGNDIGNTIIVPEFNGTRIELNIPNLSLESISTLFEFFNEDLEIFINSSRIYQRHSKFSIDLPSIGMLHIESLENISDLNSASSILPIFQGFKTNPCEQGYKNVAKGLWIHMDQTLFDARLPDRSSIIGIDDFQEQMVEETIEAVLVLLDQAPTDTKLKCYKLLEWLDALELLNSISISPPDACYTLEANFSIILDSNNSNRVIAWKTRDTPKDVYYSSNNTFKVDTLTVSRDNYKAFLAAQKSGGSVATLGGRPTPSNKELGIYNISNVDEVTDINLNGSKNLEINVYFVSCKYSSPVSVSEDDIYINTFKQVTLEDIKTCLLYLSDYEYDYVFKEDKLNEDGRVILQEYKLRTRTGEVDPIEEILADIRVRIPEYLFPREFINKTIILNQEYCK